MPVIIDTNCLANVFSKKSIKHTEFKPIQEWILRGKGIMIMGGTQYKKELAKTPKFLPIIRLIKEAGKVLEGCEKEIDAYQKQVEILRTDLDFDDPHLPAIAVVTKCKIICSEDTRSIPHVTDKKYYPKGFNAPVYYTSFKNKDLLSDKYIDKSLKPLCKIRKEEANKISKFL